MKNKRIIDSWNKIELDSAADERMLIAILTRNRSGKTEKDKVFTMNKTLNWKRLAPVVACLVFVFVLTVVIGSNANWFKPSVYKENLGDSGTLNFYKSEVHGAASFDFGVDVTSRDLTVNENSALFGELADVTAFGTFNSNDKSLLHVEGKIGETKVILATPDTPLTDVVIDTESEVSYISGVPVSAGYFITKENSQGNRNIIYFASFTLGNVSVYVELGGTEAESETLSGTIASIIEQLIANGAPALSKVIE